jgi:hypothetical protein
MVPLRHGKWAEVRTLAIGTVEQTMGPEGPEIHTQDVSYFSRLCSADTFVELATLPLHERGTERAGTVVAVMDGAAWLQEVIDGHRPDAVRILDFPHAAQYLSQAAQAAFGAGSREAAVWLDEWLPKLKAQTPEEVLAAIRALPAPSPEAAKTRTTVLTYLRKRQEQIRYAHFQEQGYPIGSGMVESGNKLVVEARLKGAGMHWDRRHVTPMVALRGVVCSGRWEQAWSGIWRQLRQQVAARRSTRREQRRAAVPCAAAAPPPAPAPVRPARPKEVIDGRPTRDHPWKKHGYDHRRLAKARAKT